MRALRTCDFCDGEAAGTFEVLPPELEPTETEQRRVVLCPDCKAQLEVLLEPLLARAGDDGEPAAGDEESATDADDTGGTVVAAADESTQKRTRTSSPNATVSESPSASDGADGPEADADVETETDDAETDADTGDTDGQSTVSGSDAGDSDTDADSNAGTDSGADTALEGGITFERTPESATKPPKGYGKVVRLLQNREFPMQRTDVENLAAGAYDLESHEVEAVVDHALEQGEFVENGGRLERPE